MGLFCKYTVSKAQTGDFLKTKRFTLINLYLINQCRICLMYTSALKNKLASFQLYWWMISQENVEQ